MATAARRLLTVEEFLEIEFSFDEGVSARIELDNGAILAMAGGNADHSRVQGNVFAALFNKLRGTDCRPHGPDMGVRVHDLSLRLPDVSVFCGRNRPEDGKLRMFDNPTLVVEVLSPSTREKDENVKLWEYQALPSLAAIIHVDPDAETVRLLSRNAEHGWQDVVVAKGDDVVLHSLGITLTWAEIFAPA
jgi:Uma2 family endonuclease